MSDGISSERLKSFVSRIESLESEKAALAADIREVYAEAKSQGFDTKIMRQVVKLRKMNQADREEQESLLESYMSALGMLGGTPLGDAAKRKAFPDAA